MSENKRKLKFLKTYSGFTSGTLGGRNDGYLETKYVTYDSFEKLVENYGSKSNECYYSLTPIDEDNLNNAVLLALEKEKEKEKKVSKNKLKNCNMS